MFYDSSSDEEIVRSVRRNTPKLDNVQQVVAQIHLPRGQAKPKIVEHHPSSQGEPSEEESPKSVAVDSHKHQEQCSSSLAKPRSTGESISYSATAQDSNGAMEEALQIEENDESSARCDELDEKESITLDQQGNEEFTAMKTPDNLENTKPGATEHENDKPQDDDKFSTEECEEHVDDLEQIQCVSKVEDSEGEKSKKPAVSEQSENDGAELEESGVVKPLENGKYSEGAEPSGSLNNSEEVKNNAEPAIDQLDGSAERNGFENSGFEDSGVVKRLENGQHPEGAQSSGSLCPSGEAENNTRPKLDQFGGSTEKNEVERSGASMTVESCVVQSHEHGESSVPTITQEPLEETGGLYLGYEANAGVAQLSGSLQHMDKTENHIKPMMDQLLEDTEKVEGERCASISTDSVPTVKQDPIQEDREVFHEGDSISECSWHSKASESRKQSTSFENDTTDESYSDDSIHTSDSFNFIEDEGKKKVLQSKATSIDGAFAGSKSLPNGDQKQQGEGRGKDASKTSPSAELGFRTIVPVIEDEGISSMGHDGSDRENPCQTCPARQSCLETEKDKGKPDVRKQGANGNKQSTVSADRKVAQQRPSAPVNIPAPQNRLLAKLRDTPSGSAGSKWSECGSFVSAVGSIRSGNSVESFHTARSGGSALQSPQAKSKDVSDHDSDVSNSSDDKPHVLPISSSFVDVICAVNRLTAFACHLCKILCPDESSQRGEHAATASSTSADEDLKNESLGIKRRLYHRLIQVLIIP